MSLKYIESVQCSQDMESTKVTITECMDKENVDSYPHWNIIES